MGNLEAMRRGPNFNDWPEIESHEISSEEFLKVFANFNHTEHRTVVSTKGNIAGNLKIFWFPNKTAVAQFKNFKDLSASYWRLGCTHELVWVKNLGTCFNRYKCSKCDYIEDVDSGD